MRRKVAYTSKFKEGSPAEEAAETPGVEAAEQVSAGGKPGAAGGQRVGHPLNLATPTRAGHGQGTSGGPIERPQDKAKPSATAKQPNPVKRETRATPKKQPAGSRKTTFGERKNLGHFLAGAGRPS